MPVAIHPVEPSFDAPAVRVYPLGGRRWTVCRVSPAGRVQFDSDHRLRRRRHAPHPRAARRPRQCRDRPHRQAGIRQRRPVTAAQHDRYRRGFPPNPVAILVPQANSPPAPRIPAAERRCGLTAPARSRRQEPRVAAFGGGRTDRRGSDSSAPRPSQPFSHPCNRSLPPCSTPIRRRPRPRARPLLFPGLAR